MTWTARNVGLTGTALNINYIVQHPATRGLNSTSHELFIATDDGIYQSVNGGRSWAKLPLPDPSNAEFSDTPAPTVDELTFHWIDFDKVQFNVLYVLAAKAASSRLWIYKSVDIGLTWTSRGVVAT